MMTFLPVLLADMVGQPTGSQPLDALVNVGGRAYAGAPGAMVETNLTLTVAKFLNTAFSLIGVIFIVLFVYAGFLWMTSSGNEQQVEKAKKIMTAAVIGAAIVFMSYAITKFVTGALSKATG